MGFKIKSWTYRYVFVISIISIRWIEFTRINRETLNINGWWISSIFGIAWGIKRVKLFLYFLIIYRLFRLESFYSSSNYFFCDMISSHGAKSWNYPVREIFCHIILVSWQSICCLFLFSLLSSFLCAFLFLFFLNFFLNLRWWRLLEWKSAILCKKLDRN